MTLKSIALPLVLASCLLATGPAQAAGKIYVGVKLGVADGDFDGFDRANLAGAYGGFNLLGKDSQFGQDLKGGTLAVEGEVLTTVRKGNAANAGRWDMASAGLYAAYRHSLTDYLYLKGKLGMVHYNIDVSSPPAPRGAGTENALGIGIGAGWRIGPGSLEVDLASYAGDITILGAGFHMNF